MYVFNLQSIKDTEPATCKLVVDGNLEIFFEESSAMRFLDLSGLAPEVQHTIEIFDAVQVLEDNMVLYAVNAKGLYDFARQKQDNALQDITYSGNLITGRHFFSGEDILFTSLPNDGNWQVSVDGEPAATGTALGTFLCVYAPEGEHEISFLYWPAGLTAGLWMMAASALLLLVVLIVEITLSKNRGKRILVKKLQ